MCTSYLFFFFFFFFFLFCACVFLVGVLCWFAWFCLHIGKRLVNLPVKKFCLEIYYSPSVSCFSEVSTTFVLFFSTAWRDSRGEHVRDMRPAVYFAWTVSLSLRCSCCLFHFEKYTRLISLLVLQACLCPIMLFVRACMCVYVCRLIVFSTYCPDLMLLLEM